MHSNSYYSIHNISFILVTFLMGVLIAQNKPDEQKHFSNPILAGYYPDPSICRVGEDYYLVNSSFAHYPGVPIFHSKDLVHWNQIGHVLDRPEQLNLHDNGTSRGIFAPSIRYHDGTFYMITTLVDSGGNFFVTAENPAGPWSNPVWLPDVHGIDPSFFFDNDGKAYIIYNGGPPDNKSLYDGHRALWMYEFDTEAMKTIGKNYLIVNGGVDISKKPVWIEGPHIFKVNNNYYVIAAEGGTGTNHSEVVLRSEKVTGPYQSYDKNPILTQRHLDPDRKYPVTCTGHADFVETQNGEWWSVFLACRPYRNGYYNTGRETFLAPVGWIDEWPIINPDFEEVQYSYKKPDLPQHNHSRFPLNGNFTLKEDFNSKDLPFYWIFLRTVREKWYDLERSKGNLRIQLRPVELWQKKNPSFIGRRQQHINCEVSAAVSFTPEFDNESAGIVAYQNEFYYYYLAKTLSRGKPVIQLIKRKESFFGGSHRQIKENIISADEPSIYQSERWAQKLKYSVPVKEGKKYLVILKFSEALWDSEGIRIFDVTIEDKNLKDIDIFRLAKSKFTAFDTTAIVQAKNNELNINIKAKKDNACICGIIVKEKAGDVIAAMNCGGEAYTSKKGFVYDKDDKFFPSREPGVIDIIKEIGLQEADAGKPIYLMLKAKGDTYGFYYTLEQGKWLPVSEDEDGTYLSTAVARGFVGVILGMHCTSKGKTSENYADFDWFEYSGNDPTFNMK